LKPIEFAGDSLARLRDFPTGARRTAGYRLDRVQRGIRLEADEGNRSGYPRTRIRDRAGAFRVIYMATLRDRVVVLHAFEKKTQRTSKQDIDLAIRRFRDLPKN
jgi:phage-related protein